jgi:imidazolonepropionase-like amidohydrolase
MTRISRNQSSHCHSQLVRVQPHFLSLILCHVIIAVAMGGATGIADGQLPPVNGMRPSDLRAHAITNATVIPAPGQKIEHATILIRNGVIEAVGSDVQIPADAQTWPGDETIVYPGLIEPALMIKTDAARGSSAYWNTRVRPEITMADQPAPDKSLRKDLRALGFTAAAVYPSSGAWRGSGVVIALADEDEHVLAYKQKAAMAAGFDYGGGGGGGRRPPGTPPAEAGAPETATAYPGSLMGAIALLRQSLVDAQWHAECRRIWNEHPSGNEPPSRSDALAALGNVVASPHNLRQQVLFEVSDELNALRAARLAQEFSLDMVILGCGEEFRHLNEIAQTKLPIILPLDFPKRPDVSTIAAADSVSLRDLMTWEQAPTNPRRLLGAGMTVALTTHSLKSRNDFLANVRTAIKHGLTEDQALAALTTTPAKLLGLEHVMGTIEKGKIANLVAVKGSLFDKDSKVRDTWVNGRRYEISKESDIQLKGSGRLKLQIPSGQSPIGQSPNEKNIAVDVDTTKSTVTLHLAEKKKINAKKVAVTNDQISFLCDGKPFGVEGYVRFSGVMENTAAASKVLPTITGNAVMPDGTTVPFVVEITEKKTIDKRDEGTQKPEAGERPEDEPKQPNGEEAPPPPVKPEAPPADPVSGIWTIRFEETPEGRGGGGMTLTLKLDGKRVSGTLSMMGREREISEGTFDPATGKLAYTTDTPMGPATTEATITGDKMTGTSHSPRGVRTFTGTRDSAGDTPTSRDRHGSTKEEVFVMPPEELNFPLGEYGLTKPTLPENVIVTNATIWTCGPQGVLNDGWMRIANGRIAEIGSGSLPGPPPAVGVKLIDARGKHITPGIIDCHSHTGINGGVNEFTQANTAECRIADCIDPDDINWYRQLAGGTTAVNQLHGSANPIGGQNSVVKIKWGAAGGAEAFPIRDAIGGIKFALGENVKRSTSRYPNTRMGVETFDRDAFEAALDYKAKWERYNALPDEKRKVTMPPRRDLELDALVEILDHKRIIHCHSYRQDEILMLIRLADSFGFQIGTFQHVLEGYKVADAIARHGAGGSTFSDWWAYKMEVMDAVPYNGALMHNAGVIVSFNSDSDELARRLNYEAAKAVRYGGVSPEDALKFVTINPARQLRIDHRTGSLEVGKDADFVVWSGDPLSSYTRCEQTWIEGACLFNLEKDAQLRQDIQRERQRIIQKILAQVHGEIEKDKSKDESPQSQPATAPAAQPGHTISKAHLAWMEEQVRLGRDPCEIRPGECGCQDEWTHGE